MRCVTGDKARTCEIVQNLQIQGQGVVASVAWARWRPLGRCGWWFRARWRWLPTGINVQVSEKAKPLPLGL